jgi:branched-chain amino acid transport system permease protein
MDRFNWKPYVVFSALVAYMFVFAKVYTLMLLTKAGVYSIVTIGMCLLVGYAGQISLGHAAFFAIGGYASAILTTRYGVPLWGGLLGALGISCSVAFLIGIPTLRLRGHYLAMATLGFGVIVYSLLHSSVEFTGGSSGLSGAPPLVVFGNDLTADNGIFYFLFVWICVGVFMLLASNIIRSRPGRALMSIHGNEEAANAAGVNTSAFKLKVFVLSAGMAAFAGFLYVHNDGFIGVNSAELMLSIIFVAMVAVGGMANLWGALFATVLLSLLPEFLRRTQNVKVEDLPHFLSSGLGLSDKQLYFAIQKMQELDVLIYGLIIIIFMIFMPQGIIAGAADLFHGAANRVRALLGRGREEEHEAS